MRVVPLTPELEPATSEFVRGRPESLVWQSVENVRRCRELYGCEDRSQVAIENDRVVGFLPILEQHEVWNSTNWAMPGGVVGTFSARAALAAWYAEHVEEARSSTVVTNPLAHAAPPVATHRVDQVAQWMELPVSIGKRARADVRKAKRLGVEVSQEPDAWAEFWSLHRRNMKAIDAASLPWLYFEGVRRHFDHELWVARQEGEMLAALLLVYHAETVEYLVPAHDPLWREVQAPAAILELALRHAADRLCKRWYWGNSTGLESVAAYKRKWGGEDVGFSLFVRVNDESLWAMSEREIRQTWGRGWYVVPYGEDLK